MSLKDLTPERYQQVKAIFDAVQNGEGTAEQLCQQDADLLACVREMLAAAEQTQTQLPPQTELAPVDAALLGQQVGLYLIEKHLGSGGMGAVFLGWHVEMGHHVALKFLGASLMNTAAGVLRFRRECEVLCKLQHNHIVRCYEVEIYQERPFMVMEFIAGDSLTVYQRRQADQSVRAKLELFLKICDGVIHAHSRGFSHRDLKPLNILVTADGMPHILDFGLAGALTRAQTVVEDQPTTLPALGSPYYMSPEQAQEQPNVGPLSDQYSLGVILYELLTGKLPYHLDPTPSVKQIMQAVAQQVPQPLGPVTRDRLSDLETVIQKALAKNPEERFATVEAFAKDLRHYLEVKPVTVRPVAWWLRTWYGMRRHPAVTAARVLATLLLTVVFAGGPLVAFSLYQAYTQAEQELQRAKTLAAQNDQLTREKIAQDQKRIENQRVVGIQLGLAKDVLHQGKIDAARNALRRGKWSIARRAFDEAIADKIADKNDLRVERLRCLFDLESRQELFRELDELARLPLPAHLRLLVQMHQGDVAMWDVRPERQQAARKYLMAALQMPAGPQAPLEPPAPFQLLALPQQAVPDKLAAHPGLLEQPPFAGLSKADDAYARGLLAEGTPEAVQHFQAALKADPFHHRANVALILELTLSGQFDLAERRTQWVRDLFGADVATVFCQAFMAALRADRQGVQQWRDELCELVRQPVDRKRIEKVMQLFEAIGASKHHPLAMPFNPLALLFVELDKVGPGTTLGLGCPLLRRPVVLVQALAQVQQRLVKMDYANASKLAQEALTRHPEALLVSMYAFARMGLAWEHEKCGDLAACQRELLVSRQLFLRAAEAPTLIPATPNRHQARWMAFLVDTVLLMHFRPHRPALAAGTVSHLVLAGHGPLPLQATLSVPLAAYPPGWWPDRRLLLRVLLDSSPKDDFLPVNYHTIEDKLEPEDARILLAAWVHKVPTDLTPLRHRAKLELRTGNYSAAVAFANRVLTRQPNDTLALEIRREATKKLGKLPPAK